MHLRSRKLSSKTVKVLPRRFYARDPEIVAKGLLGKKLVRRPDDKSLEGVIVETEAYYGLEDPASRAYRGQKIYNRLMWSQPGRVFIYNVHNNWMFNIVAHEQERIGAVLIRAIEPTKGIEEMKKNRPVVNVVELANGPGKLTRALRIDKTLNGVLVTSAKHGIFLVSGERDFEIKSSHRIGVKEDLNRELRFFIRDNRFVSD